MKMYPHQMHRLADIHTRGRGLVVAGRRVRPQPGVVIIESTALTAALSSSTTILHGVHVILVVVILTIIITTFCVCRVVGGLWCARHRRLV